MSGIEFIELMESKKPTLLKEETKRASVRFQDKFDNNQDERDLLSAAERKRRKRILYKQ